MTLEKKSLDEQIAHLRHELTEALNYFCVAKMNLLSPRPEPKSAGDMFASGEEKLKAVIEQSKYLGG